MKIRHPRAPLLVALLGLLPGCGSTGSATDEGSTGSTGPAVTDSASTDTPTSSASSESAGSGVTPECTPILGPGDLETGFEKCEDGSTHRYAALVCPGQTTTDMNPCMPAPPPEGCSADAECTAEPLGYCAQAHMLSGYCGCFYGCQKDADCGPGSICACGGVVGRCLPASCTTNADCDPGFGCVATTEGPAGPACTSDADPNEPTRYACQAPADECKGDLDCPSDGPNTGACFLDGDHRVCGSVCQMPP